MEKYDEDEYLMLSGIQHFTFCRRQWALIHIEQQWEENYRTVDGKIMHNKAHNDEMREKRGDVIITRGMTVSSPTLGISGECDVVEFRRSHIGIPIHGEEGLYQVVPIEYKRGQPKADDSDKLQLTAQAMCLEEMLCCKIPEGFIYYGETRHRLHVDIDLQLRDKVKEMVGEMHDYLRKRYTPKAKRTKACNACSLKDLCLPGISKRTASAYVRNVLAEDFVNEKIT